jgi:transposase
MANAMLDARKEADSYRRIEVITGERRRRRWTAEEKAQIVAESFEEGANISEVARRHSVSRGLLTVWRHKCMTAANIEAPHFVPVRVDNGSGSETSVDPEHFPPRHTALLERAAPTAMARGVIEVELNGARIRVEPGADSETLSTVLIALRGSR